jgi:hypothetical protein
MIDLVVGLTTARLSMPHYYLDVRYPHLVVEDATGHDFIDLNEAMQIAHVLLLQIRAANLVNSLDWPRVEISDDNGLMATVPKLPEHIPLPGAGRA